MALFRARNRDRDARSDKARLDALVRHIGDVKTGIMKERRGLERRYADAIGDASHLVDTDYSVEREAEDEQALVQAEADVVYAHGRIVELDRQLGVLDGLVERVNVLFDPPEALEKRRSR
ncbi:MAG: hypothetical protein KI785_03605 [Devosiaceae bacterium]|nr:hypothetical protein [Devosiaceae bacterium MH13]